MIKEDASIKRSLKTVPLSADLIVTGGGLSGTCCAITAARAGIKVVLVQDRPILGGNSSSEIRLWVLGATSHMGNNNRWAREGGVINELLVENTWRNPEGNPYIFDTVILEKVVNEKNITLLLNCAVYEVNKTGDSISMIKAFCSQNSTLYELSAPLFCDASGDGIVAFLAGAAFRMGAESSTEFGEKFAPTAEYGELLGHSIYFYTRDTGKPVKFVPPSYVLDDITRVPHYKKFNTKEFGCQLWWIEYGGRLDTVHDTEQIKWELWKVVYGAWNYIKNSGNFPEAATMTLEWVGTIPGKRESRRFEGDYLLKQQDIIEQKQHEDAVAFGGWSIDLHPADGVFSEKPGCNQWHSKGVYQIPYRCLYSRNVSNLFLAGRIISVTHVAFGSSRVMATSACVGQAVGMAAVYCAQNKVPVRALLEKTRMMELQQSLLKVNHYIPGIELHDPLDLAAQAEVTASSEMILRELPFNGRWILLDHSAGQMLPLTPGLPLTLTARVNASDESVLNVELRCSSKVYNHTPDVILEQKEIRLRQGDQDIQIHFERTLSQPGYGFICFLKNEKVKLMSSRTRMSGILSVFNKVIPEVSNFGKQEPGEDIGIETFEFWCPDRRPSGENIALAIEPGIREFSANNLTNGIDRPVSRPNAWVAAENDESPSVTLSWPGKVKVSRIVLGFDTDYDHPMESVLMTHPETDMPFCVRDFRILDESGTLLYEQNNNHEAIRTIEFPKAIQTRRLRVEMKRKSADIPCSLFFIRCYS